MSIADLLLIIAFIICVVDLAMTRGRSLCAWAILFVLAALFVMGHGLRA